MNWLFLMVSLSLSLSRISVSIQAISKQCCLCSDNEINGGKSKLKRRKKSNQIHLDVNFNKMVRYVEFSGGDSYAVN